MGGHNCLGPLKPIIEELSQHCEEVDVPTEHFSASTVNFAFVIWRMITPRARRGGPGNLAACPRQLGRLAAWPGQLDRLPAAAWPLAQFGRAPLCRATFSREFGGAIHCSEFGRATSPALPRLLLLAGGRAELPRSPAVVAPRSAGSLPGQLCVRELVEDQARPALEMMPEAPGRVDGNNCMGLNGTVGDHVGP